MKRIAIAAAAALVAAGSLATPAAAQTYGQHNGQNGNGRWDGDRDNNGRRDRGDSRNDNRGDRNHRDDRRGDRDHRRDGRWDNQRHNGYTYNGRWYYGPAPAAYRDRADYGYRNWRRGERLPAYYSSRYRQVDYRREHLRAPPRGYRYVEDDRGDMLLVGIATGVILSIILSQ